MSDDLEEKIRARAYAIWREEGQPPGREREHWERARREIQQQQGETSQGSETSQAAGSPPPSKPRKSSSKAGEAAPAKTPMPLKGRSRKSKSA